MALKAFLADPYTRSMLGREGLEELSRNLWPGLCQTCGSPLGDTEPPAVVVLDDELFFTASLHHRGCQRPRWTRTDPPPSGRHLSTTVALMAIPFGDPARAPFLPTLLVNPGLEEVTLAPDGPGRARATTVASYRPWGLTPPGATLERADPDLVCCWIGQSALTVRCGPMHWQFAPLPDEQVLAGIRRRDDLVLALSTAFDPAQLRNPEPVKRVLRGGDLTAVRAPLSRRPAPALTGHTLMIDSDLAAADETRDDHWLGETLPYAGPSYDPASGRFSLGTSMDGPVHWRLNTPGVGVENGLVLGAESSGKTNHLRLVAVEAAASGIFVIAVADPLDRDSLVSIVEPWVERVARSREDTVHLLAWGAAVVDARAASGAPYQDPSRARPGVLLVVDDAHEVFTDPTAAALAERIAVAGPHLGVGVVVASRSARPGDFGGRPELLAALAATNAIAYGQQASRQLNELGKAC